MVREMTKLTFFYHKRKDAAVRIGVEVEEDRVLERYIPGQENSDSALLWYIDVRCSTDEEISADSEAVRKFFLKLSTPIQVALKSVANELSVGLDSDIWPNKWGLKNLPQGISGEIVCSATRRITDGELVNVLLTLANEWPELIADLQPLAAFVN